VAVPLVCKTDEFLLLSAGRGGERKEDSCLVWRGSGRRRGQQPTASSWVLILLSAGLGGEGEVGDCPEPPVFRRWLLFLLFRGCFYKSLALCLDRRSLRAYLKKASLNFIPDTSVK
jgi:hypothetical protein